MNLPVDISITGVTELEAEIMNSMDKCSELRNSLNSLLVALSSMGVQISQPIDETAD